VTVSRPVREAVANLARRARQEQDVDDILETITHTAVDVIDGVDYCSVSFAAARIRSRHWRPRIRSRSRPMSSSTSWKKVLATTPYKPNPSS
jgi:hypothetical protein